MVMKSFQGGYLGNPLTVPLAMAALMSVVFAGLTVYFYAQSREVRQNIDDKVAAAIVEAEAGIRKQLQKEFDEKAKRPFDTYQASPVLSGVKIVYPRTWSAYVIEDPDGRRQINGYFHPDYVPTAKTGVKYALRLILEDGDYAKELKDYQRDIDSGSVKASPIRVSGVKGTRLDGAIEKGVNSSMVIFPIRDKVLKVWTQSPDFLDDFNNTIVKNLSFNP